MLADRGSDDDMNTCLLFLFVVSISLLSGCAGNAPLHAGWYRTAQPGNHEIFLSLMNTQSTEVSIESLVINEDETTKDGGWKHGTISRDSPLVLRPGELRLLSLEDFQGPGMKWGSRDQAWGCRLPVSARATPLGGCRPVEVEGLPSPPSAIPPEFVEKCRWP
jgi:hypothetical protein